MYFDLSYLAICCFIKVLCLFIWSVERFWFSDIVLFAPLPTVLSSVCSSAFFDPANLMLKATLSHSSTELFASLYYLCYYGCFDLQASGQTSLSDYSYCRTQIFSAFSISSRQSSKRCWFLGPLFACLLEKTATGPLSWVLQWWVVW